MATQTILREPKEIRKQAILSFHPAMAPENPYVKDSAYAMLWDSAYCLTYTAWRNEKGMVDIEPYLSEKEFNDLKKRLNIK